MTKITSETIDRFLILLGIRQPKDETVKKHMEYMEFNRKLTNLRRSVVFAAILSVILFVIWFNPNMIPAFDYYVPMILVGGIIALALYMFFARYLYYRLLEHGQSRQETAKYQALIIFFWSAYYSSLILVMKLFESNTIECMAIWMTLMGVGLTSHIFDKAEALFIFPISVVNIYFFVKNLEVVPILFIVCTPTVLFFFLIVQITHFEGLGYDYNMSKSKADSAVDKRRLGNVFDKVYDVAFEINMATGACEFLKINELYNVSSEDEGINMAPLFERAIENAHPDDKYLFAKNLNYDYLNAELMKGSNQLYFEGRMKTTEGDYCWLSVMFTRGSVKDEEQFVLCLIQNIDERKIKEAKLRLEAEKDPLTKLYNKTTTKSLIEECLEKNQSTQHALLIIDIDNFKTINDTRGHAVGDQILLAFTTELNKNFRETDILGRAGGDEFVVLIKNVNSVAMVCDKLQRFTSSFKKYGIENGFPGRLSCSIGVAMFNKDGRTFEELFKRADAALYEAKRNGKDQYKFSITRS